MSKRVETTIREQERHWRVVAKRFKGRHQRWMVAGIRASARVTGGTGPRSWSDHVDRLMRVATAEGVMRPGPVKLPDVRLARMNDLECEIDVSEFDEIDVKGNPE